MSQKVAAMTLTFLFVLCLDNNLQLALQTLDSSEELRGILKTLNKKKRLAKQSVRAHSVPPESARPLVEQHSANAAPAIPGAQKSLSAPCKACLVDL